MLLTETAGACVAVVDEQGRYPTPIVDPGGSVFIGKLVGVRAADLREIKQLRARWNSSAARQAMSDQELLELIAQSTRIAEFAEQPAAEVAEPSMRSIWFENTHVCPGPFNEGMPLEVGQTAVVFTRVVDGVPLGWIPNMVSVERLEREEPLLVMNQLFERSEHCHESFSGDEHYTVPTTFLRAPASGFGRGCLAEMRQFSSGGE